MCNLSRSGGDRLAVAFPSALQFLFPIMAEDGSCPSCCDRIHVAFCLLVATRFSSPSGFGVVGCGRRHPGRRDLVATGWLSPSCSEGDAPMVAFQLPVFLALVAVPGWPTALLGVSGRGTVRAVPSHVVVSGMGPQLGRAAVVYVCVFFALAHSPHSTREVVDSGLTWLLRCSVNLLSRRVHAEGCFRFVFDSVGSVGVMSGPTLVVGRGITRFRCFVVASFPAGFKCELQESVAAIAGCVCYEHGCWFARAAVEFVVGLRVHVGVSRRLREPTYGVAFTVGVFARAKQMLVCHVAPLVERCYTFLWLLSALCWIVVNSGELLPEFFSVGSSGSEVSPE
ncbi:hypothetical protein Taro_036314 [Colocasia esculenta]|uniref:Uncharacterized protein n=1 Tax=Colocasia esculenta TaxID=4460 RepID=A0A843WLB4_COLES|nr:hypothetical protein [Colocasia esculenta]